jgi:hypothetical protein
MILRSLHNTPLSPSAQTAYAQVFDHVLALSVHRSVADLPGNFAKKIVSGKEYWYFQYRDIDSKVKQIYLGPRSDRLEKLIETKAAFTEKQEALAKQARAAIELGNESLPKSQYKVIRRLDDYGLFRAGGVLIGTHAFACYGNMFGVAWLEFQKTHDMDFAFAGRSMSIALPSDMQINLHDAISSLEMGFLPNSKFDGLVGGTYVVPHDPDFRIDFLTTIGRENSDLVNFPHLNMAMVPLKFMEYSLVDIKQAALLSESGAILANVPNPARFALHKLIVAGERDGQFRTKAKKDIWQSAALISYLIEHQPEELADAWIDLHERGKGWRNRFAIGMRSLLKEFPNMKELIAACEKAVEHRKKELAELGSDSDGNDMMPSPP